MTEPIFWKIFSFCPKRTIFDSKLTLLIFSLNLFIRFFSKSDSFGSLKKILFYYAGNEGNESSLGPKSTLLNFYLNFSLIQFFWNCTWWKVLKSGYTWLFLIFKEYCLHIQNGVNGTCSGPQSLFLTFANLFISLFEIANPASYPWDVKRTHTYTSW